MIKNVANITYGKFAEFRYFNLNILDKKIDYRDSNKAFRDILIAVDSRALGILSKTRADLRNSQ